jgi:hypothetical protein
MVAKSMEQKYQDKSFVPLTSKNIPSGKTGENEGKNEDDIVSCIFSTRPLGAIQRVIFERCFSSLGSPTDSLGRNSDAEKMKEELLRPPHLSSPPPYLVIFSL